MNMKDGQQWHNIHHI